MKTLLWTLVGVVSAGLVMGILAWRGRRRRTWYDQDVSPDWINENVYGRGKQGDDEWK